MKIAHGLSMVALVVASVCCSSPVFSQGLGGRGTAPTNTTGGTTGTTGTTATRGTTAGTTSTQGTEGTATTTMAGSGDVRRFSDVGTGTTGTRGTTGGLGGLGGLGGFGGLGGLSGLGLNPFGTTSTTTDSKPTIRTRLRSEVDIPARSVSNVQNSVQQQAVRNYSQPRFQGVGTSFEGSNAVIRGTVSNEKDRRMAELLLRLEPGISTVENRIIVAP
jgi:hypothetical protein